MPNPMPDHVGHAVAQASAALIRNVTLGPVTATPSVTMADGFVYQFVNWSECAMFLAGCYHGLISSHWLGLTDPSQVPLPQPMEG